MNYSPERLHTIEINWGFPIPIENIQTNWKSSEIGIYYISRVFGGKETPIYIGKTEQSFEIRMNQHFRDNSSFLNKRGAKYIRLGHIVRPKNLSGYDLTRLLLTIESVIINEINPLLRDNLTNVSQSSSYTAWYDLHIINSGKRGMIPSDITLRVNSL